MAAQKQILTLAEGIGMGVGLSYFLDPQSGGARRAKVLACKPLARARLHLRKALGEIDARDAAPLRDQPEREAADRTADRRDRAQWQEMREPHQHERDAAQPDASLASGGGSAPRGRL